MADYQRIEQLLKHLNMSARALALALGLKNPQIFYDIKAEKCGISKELAIRIQEHFLNISAAWLLTGEGEMLKDSSTNVGEVSGNDNTIGMTVTQTIAENNGQNAGRDINNPPGDRALLDEIIAQRKITETAQMQLTTAQAQITELINQNKEQFAQFMALFQSLKQATI